MRNIFPKKDAENLIHELLCSQPTVIDCYQDVKIFPWEALRWPKLLQLECWWELRRVFICLLYWLPRTSRIESEILLPTSTAFWGQTPSLFPKTTLLSDSWFAWGSLNLQKWNGQPLAIRLLCFRAGCPSRYLRLTPFALIGLVLNPSPLRDVIITHYGGTAITTGNLMLRVKTFIHHGLSTAHS